MILNGIAVDDALIDRYLHMSYVPIGQNPSIWQSERIKGSSESGKLPRWMYSLGVDYFNKQSLIEENENLCDEILTNDHWLMGGKVSGICPGKVDPSRLALIAYNIMGENFLGLYSREGRLQVIATDKVNGVYCWRVVFHTFDVFLKAISL